jgi:hypothetical protein
MASRKSTYRVNGFYKDFIPKPRKKQNTLLDGIFADLDAELSPKERERKSKRIRVVQCTREEAQYVSGTGVSGCIARIEDVEIVGLVKWKKHDILKERKNYKVMDRDWPTEIYKYWED